MYASPPSTCAHSAAFENGSVQCDSNISTARCGITCNKTLSPAPKCQFCCNAGFFEPDGTNPRASCHQGSWRFATVAALPIPRCARCPIDTYSSPGSIGTTATSTELHGLLRTNKLSNAWSAICVLCLPGRWDHDHSPSTPCVQCDTGKARPGNVSNTVLLADAAKDILVLRDAGGPRALECAVCPPMTFSRAGATACTICPRGQYSTANGSHRCVGNRTSIDCHVAGGEVALMPHAANGRLGCQFRGATCPPGWSQYLGWSTTLSTKDSTCAGTVPRMIQTANPSWQQWHGNHGNSDCCGQAYCATNDGVPRWECGGTFKKLCGSVPSSQWSKCAYDSNDTLGSGCKVYTAGCGRLCSRSDQSSNYNRFRDCPYHTDKRCLRFPWTKRFLCPKGGTVHTASHNWSNDLELEQERSFSACGRAGGVCSCRCITGNCGHDTCTSQTCVPGRQDKIIVAKRIYVGCIPI